MLVWPLDPVPVNQLEEGFIMPAFLDDFVRLVQVMHIGPGLPDDVVLAKESARYQAWHTQMVADRFAADQKELDAKVFGTNHKKPRLDHVADRWEAEHLELFRDAKMKWPPNISVECCGELALALKHLPRRQQECAYFFVHSREFKDAGRTFHDLNVGLEYKSCMHEIVMTLLATSIIFDREAMKVLSGGELMSLQGYGFDAATEHPESNAHLSELAGNMFNGYVLGAVITSLLATLPLATQMAATDSGVVGTAVGEPLVPLDGDDCSEFSENGESEVISVADDCLSAASLDGVVLASEDEAAA
jgi:hypothetical protein